MAAKRYISQHVGEGKKEPDIAKAEQEIQNDVTMTEGYGSAAQKEIVKEEKADLYMGHKIVQQYRADGPDRMEKLALLQYRLERMKNSGVGVI